MEVSLKSGMHMLQEIIVVKRGSKRQPTKKVYLRCPRRRVHAIDEIPDGKPESTPVLVNNSVEGHVRHPTEFEADGDGDSLDLHL
jgi:hypothetical protein